MNYPSIIQGGMGAAVSNWRLANAVSACGQMGVVSSTALDTVMARRLQDGDEGGFMRKALEHFPIAEVAERILQKYYRAEGRPNNEPYRLLPLARFEPDRSWEEMVVAANFAEVFLAKLGHVGSVGINLMEKLQLPTLPSLYGSLLAGVDYVLMGAGIPRSIPAVLDKLSANEEAELRIDVHNAPKDASFIRRFNPQKLFGELLPKLQRPKFLAVVGSQVLATTLAKKADGHVDGFVIENLNAGGHNAPPRGTLQIDAQGEPIYGERDTINLEAIRALGRPFWLAGSFTDKADLDRAFAEGAQGVQIGTPFAFCEESGVAEDVRQSVVEHCLKGDISVFTDPKLSPTGFPFKVIHWKDQETLRGTGKRSPCEQCDLGYLRELYYKEDGGVGYRCPAEPVESYLKKGGNIADTEGRQCLCNGLLATIGIGQQRRDGAPRSLPIITSGKDVLKILKYLKPGKTSYSARDVIASLLGETTVLPKLSLGTNGCVTASGVPTASVVSAKG